MKDLPLWLFVIFASGNLLAVGKSWKRLEYFTKPAAILALIAWVWNASRFQGQTAWFAVGLVFSLAGDILLILPRERFIAAWLAFLLAYAAYILGLNQTFPPINLPSLLLLITVSLVAIRLARIILAGLRSSGSTELQFPIAAYSLVISALLLSALLPMVRADWLEGHALMVSAGGILLFISDAVLALHRFVAPIRRNALIVMSTYHLGQVFIITGACLHYILPSL